MLLAAGALVLRLYQIGGDSLWLDEGYTLLFSGMPLQKLLLVGGAHEHPPLYYLTVHTLRALHESYFIPRYVSAVCGTLSILALYALGARVHSRVAGLIAAVLLALAPFHVWFSRDGRGYEMAGLLVILSYYWLFTAVQAPRRRNWVLYAFCTALVLYAEYTCVLALAPQALALAPAIRRGFTRSLLLAWGGAVLLFAPWIGTLAIDAASIAGNYWIPAPNPTLWANAVLEYFGLMTSCSAQPCAGTELGIPGLAGHEVVVAVIASAGALAVAVWALRRRNFTLGLLSLWLIGPMALGLLVSIAQSIFLDRIFLDATFPLYLLIGIGVASGFRLLRLGTAVLAVLMVAASIATLRPIYAYTANPDWKTAIRDFNAAYRPGQAVAYYPGALRSLLAAYLPPGWKATKDRPMWSRVYVDVPGWTENYPTLYGSTFEQRQQIEEILRDKQLKWATTGTDGVWLLTEDYAGISDTRRWFASRGYQLLLGVGYTNDARMEYWTRKAPSSFGPMAVGGSPWTWGASTPVKPQRRNGVLIETAGVHVQKGFAVQAGAAYTVNVEYRGIPPARPTVGVWLWDADGKSVGFFPRVEWYDLPVNGMWLSQPFGFVAPPGAVRATIALGSEDGTSEWRHIAVYRER